MIYELNEGTLKEVSEKDITQNSKYIILSDMEKARDLCEKFGISQSQYDAALSSKSGRLESHENLDIICAHLIDYSTFRTVDTVYMFIKSDFLLLTCNNLKNASFAIDRFNDKKLCGKCISAFVLEFFEYILENKQKYLDKIELNIINFEEEILLKKQKKDYIRKLTNLRKQLLFLKRYYEQLLDILSDIDENENDIYEDSIFKPLRLVGGKADRQYHNVLNLRDYVTQIREAYQEEVDISLNETMKVFTVITAIFFPLTLLVGWYGMNLKMPEFQYQYSYPIVIAASIVIVAISIYIFKKRKWF